MANPLISSLEHMAGLMKDVDSLKDKVADLPGTTGPMVKQKANMRNSLTDVFAELVHFQQELLNTQTAARPKKEES